MTRTHLVEQTITEMVRVDLVRVRTGVEEAPEHLAGSEVLAR